MKKPMSYCSAILGLIFFVSGCTSMVGSQNVDFISGQSQLSDGKNTLVICRPSSYYKAFESIGVTINSSPVADIGSGQLYSIDSVKSNRLDVEFTLPVSETMWSMGKWPKSFSLRLDPSIPTQFILLGVENANIESLPNYSTNPMDMSFQISSHWMAKPVDAKTMIDMCGKYAPNFLASKALPKITSNGVLPISSGYKPAASAPIKPSKEGSQRAHPSGLPLIKSNQISQRYLLKIGFYGYGNGSYIAYIDRKSAIRNKEAIEINVVKEFAVEQNSGKAPFNNEVNKLGIDCQGNRYRLIESANYLSVSDESPEMNKKDFSSSGLAQWMPIVPDSLAQGVAKNTCQLTVK